MHLLGNYSGVKSMKTFKLVTAFSLSMVVSVAASAGGGGGVFPPDPAIGGDGKWPDSKIEIAGPGVSGDPSQLGGKKSSGSITISHCGDFPDPSLQCIS